MRSGNFTDEFKRDAVAQTTERGYPVAEVSKRLGVSQHSLYAWRRCLIPGFDGPFLSSESKDALWARFFTAAPRRLRRSVERYNIVKRV